MNPPDIKELDDELKKQKKHQVGISKIILYVRIYLNKCSSGDVRKFVCCHINAADICSGCHHCQCQG